MGLAIVLYIVAGICFLIVGYSVYYAIRYRSKNALGVLSFFLLLAIWPLASAITRSVDYGHVKAQMEGYFNQKTSNVKYAVSGKDIEFDSITYEIDKISIFKVSTGYACTVDVSWYIEADLNGYSTAKIQNDIRESLMYSWPDEINSVSKKIEVYDLTSEVDIYMNGSKYEDYVKNNSSSSVTCRMSGCTRKAATSGDTVYCTIHSNNCYNCGCYIDADALYCMDCLRDALD